MYIEKQNRIDVKKEIEKYKERYRVYATINSVSESIVNIDVFYKHSPKNTDSVVHLNMFNRFYKPFSDIDWNNTADIEWLKEEKRDIDFLKARGQYDYHYRYYIDKGTYSVIQELEERGFVPVVWKLPRYVERVKELESKERTEKENQELSNCRRKMQMLYLAFVPTADENFLRHEGLAQISKYLMLHDLVYIIKKYGYTDLKQVCRCIRKKQDIQKNRKVTNRNTYVVDHNSQIEKVYTSAFPKRIYPYTNIEHKKKLYNFIDLVWYIENADMPSANNLMSNLYEIDSDINSKVKNKLIDRNRYMLSVIDSEYKTQIITLFLSNTFSVPCSSDKTNIIEIIFPLKEIVGESAGNNYLELYKKWREAGIKQNKTEAELLYDYAIENGLKLRYRAITEKNKDELFLLWLNRVPIYAVVSDLECVKEIVYKDK